MIEEYRKQELTGLGVVTQLELLNLILQEIEVTRLRHVRHGQKLSAISLISPASGIGMHWPPEAWRVNFDRSENVKYV